MSDSLLPLAACQASLSITNSQSPLKPMSIESVMPSNHLILCHPLLLLPSSFPASGSFPMSQLFVSGGQSIGVSASTSVLPMNTQDWYSIFGWQFCLSFSTLNIPFHFLVHNEPLFSCSFKNSFLVFDFWQFTHNLSWCGLSGFTFLECFMASWIWISTTFPRFGAFSHHFIK